jgi:ribosomal-protein-alanine N-acetyltransferase
MTIDNIFQSFPQIETRNLVLRRIQEPDSQAIFRILSDEEVTRYYDDATFAQIDQANYQIQAWENGFKHERCIRWGITLKNDLGVVGTCGFYGFHSWHMRASIGYELGRPFWRQGIMTEALTAIMRVGFMEMDLNRIEAVVMPENQPSIKLLEKLGFANEGVLKEYENWGSKGFKDLCMFAMIRKRWEENSHLT